jgi:predicted MFS family arabinose efflux permease
MVIGSSLGGILSKYVGYRGSVLVSSGIIFLIIILDIFYLPDFKETTQNEKEENTKPIENKVGMINQAKEYFKVLSEPKIKDITIIITLASLGIGSFSNIFPLAAKSKFNMESSDLGVYISFLAIVGLISNVFIVGSLIKNFGEGKTIQLSIISLTICYFCIAMINTFELLVLITIPITISSTLLYTISSSLMSISATSENIGTAISISHSSRSLIGIISPLIGGYIFQNYDYFYLGLFSSFTLFFCFLIFQFICHDSFFNIPDQ